jgi:hypothetical protein
VINAPGDGTWADYEATILFQPSAQVRAKRWESVLEYRCRKRKGKP